MSELLMAAGITGEHCSTPTLVWEALHEEWDEQIWRHCDCRDVTWERIRSQDCVAIESGQHVKEEEETVAHAT